MVEMFQTEKRHNKNKNSASSIYSINSYKSQNPNRFSTYAPSIEGQLNSLVIENKDSQGDAVELLRQDFEESSIDNEYYLPSISFKGSLNHSPLSSLAHISYNSDKTDAESHKVSPSISSQLFEEKSNAKSPIVIGKYPNYYIPTPSRVRNYLEKPDAYILKTMKLPYPYRVKEPTSHRLNRSDKSNPLQIDIDVKSSPQFDKNKIYGKYLDVSPQPLLSSRKLLDRHSLALGQVDRLLKVNKSKSFDDSYTDSIYSEDIRLEDGKCKQIYSSRSRKSSALSSRAVQDILKWIPDQDTVWQENKSNDSLQMIEIPSNTTNSRQKRPLHPLDYSPCNT